MKKDFNKIIIELRSGYKEVMTLFEAERVLSGFLKKGIITKIEYNEIGNKLLNKKIQDFIIKKGQK